MPKQANIIYLIKKVETHPRTQPQTSRTEDLRLALARRILKRAG